MVTIALVSCEAVTISNSEFCDWVVVDQGPVPLRCWHAAPHPDRHVDGSESIPKRVVIVLPEVFGVNAWVRGVANRISSQGIPALAMPLFARTAPAMALGYSDDDLLEGRRHKDLTTTDQILADLSASIAWLMERYPAAEISVVGFCFGGHAALLAATLPAVASSVDFYGAGVSRMRPGGGPPSLELLPQVRGRLTCICGSADPLIPESDRRQIAAALSAADVSGKRLRYVELQGADHGFMCDVRQTFDPEAAAQGWRILFEHLTASQ